MNILPQAVTRVIEEFSRLPGIGPKTASRLTFYLLNRPEQEVSQFSNAVAGLRANLVRCQNCFNISEQDLCPICRDQTRNHDTIMVVAEPLDIVALERTGYKGLYHVLGGVISPIDGVGPDDLTLSALIKKLSGQDNQANEVILATNPSLEGEATALYITRIVNERKDSGSINKDLSLTRIARGLPVGGDVEYADQITLTQALEGRKSV